MAFSRERVRVAKAMYQSTIFGVEVDLNLRVRISVESNKFWKSVRNSGLSYTVVLGYQSSKDRISLYRGAEVLEEASLLSLASFRKSQYFGGGFVWFRARTQECERTFSKKFKQPQTYIFATSYHRPSMWQSLRKSDFSILHTYCRYLQQSALKFLANPTKWRPKTLTRSITNKRHVKPPSGRVVKYQWNTWNRTRFKAQIKRVDWRLTQFDWSYLDRPRPFCL